MPCSTRQESQPFKSWGDYGSYFRTLNGGFEDGLTSWWTWNYVATAAENQPWRLTGSSYDNRSLVLPAGSYAEATTLCVVKGEETVRFFVKPPAATGSTLRVDFFAWDRATLQWVQWTWRMNSTGRNAWTPSPVWSMPAAFGYYGYQDVAIRFGVEGTSGTWMIDDVMVDPLRSY